MNRLENKVAIVTGAGQGVGRGVALALAGEGAKVAVVGRTLAKCEAVVAEIEGRGGRAIALLCDVESRAAVDATVAETLAAFGRLDILVNTRRPSFTSRSARSRRTICSQCGNPARWGACGSCNRASTT